MKITSIPNYNCRPNYINRTNPKVSFGEIEGGSLHWNTRMSDIQYEARRQAIIDEYNEIRISWLKTCDALGISKSDMWKELSRIKNQEVQALGKLESEYVR